jgi:hypothetical protein
MNFVKFTETPKRTLYCTVNPRGVIYLNIGIKREFSLEKNKFAVLYHDLEKKLFVIEFICDETEEYLYKIVNHSSGAYINAMGFVRFLGICKEKKTMFPVKKDSDNRIIVDFSHAETI